MLWECRRLKKPTITNDDNLEREAGLRLSRRILTCCLDTLLKVLAVPLSQKQFKLKSKKLGDLKILGNEDRYKQMKQLITMSIQGLQIVAKLCNNLGNYKYLNYTICMLR